MQLVIDLKKSINKAKLIQRMVQVRGKDGKIFTRHQWINPNKDNEVVMEHGTHEDDPHKKFLSGLKPMDKVNLMNRVSKDHPEHVLAMANHLHGTDHTELTEELKDSVTYNYGGAEKIPSHILSEYLPEYGVSPSDHEVISADEEGDSDFTKGKSEESLGRIGIMDFKEFDRRSSWGDNLYDMLIESEGEVDSETESSFRSIFKDLSSSQIGYAFTPHGTGYHTHVAAIESTIVEHYDPYEDSDLEYQGFTVYMDLFDPDDTGDNPDTRCGFMERVFYRDSNETLCVTHELFSLSSAHQNNKLGSKINSSAYQLYKHMARGEEVKVNLLANISVGTYAWSRQGFDFANKMELDFARKQLTKYCESNGMDLESTLNSCGYKSINSLKHSWQFSSLDDGTRYKLPVTSDLRGDKVHLGKHFMLTGKAPWDGVKTLNGGEESEFINKTHELTQEGANKPYAS